MRINFGKLSGTLALAGLLAVGCSGNGDAGTPGQDGQDGRLATAGLKFEIVAATVPASGAPTIHLKVTDAAGVPVDLPAEIAAKTIAPRYTVAALDGATGSYTSLYEGAVAAKSYTDSNGVAQAPTGSATQASSNPPRSVTGEQLLALYQTIARGEYVFTFPSNPNVATLPAQTAVHTVGVWGTRTFEGVGYPASATFDFVPTGLTAATGREVVSDAACNACHGKLQAHDSRRTVKLCLTCHSPQTKDPETGNSLAMAEMIHKLHSGLDGYHIVGYSQHDVDYSKVAFAPPNSVANCAACHGGAAEADKAKVASVAACSTCHTSFDVTTHQEGTATPESCADCHPAAGVDKVHSELYAGKGLSFTETKLEITIDSVSYPTAGAAGTVAFTVKVNDAPRDVMASPLSSLRFTVAGPTEDYGSGIDSDSTVLGGTTPGYVQSAASPTFTAIDAAAGKFSIPLPALTGDVDGKSVGVGVEAYVYEFVSIGAPACASATAGPATATCVRKQHVGTPTAMVYAKVGGGTPTPRRTITSNAKCNACHNDLGFHSGDSRKTPEYCATCHNPVNVNDDRTTRLERTLDGSGVPTSTVYSFTPESVSIMMMAHKLHAGGALSNSYVLGNDMSMSATAPIATSATFAGAFPGDLADCQTCHEEGTYGLPDAGNLGTLEATFTCLEPQGNDTDNWCNTKANWPLANVPDNYTVTAQRFIPPQTAACTSCHDSEAAKAHAELNTSPSGVESCAVCHGEGATYDAIEVHVPRP